MRRGDITQDVHHKLEKLETDHDQLIRELEDFGAVKRKKSAPGQTGKERKKTVVDELDKRIEEAWDTAENALSGLDFLKKGRLWEFEKRLCALDVEVLYELPYSIECCVKKENPKPKPPMSQHLRVMQENLDRRNPANTSLLFRDGAFKEKPGYSPTKAGRSGTGESPRETNIQERPRVFTMGGRRKWCGENGQTSLPKAGRESQRPHPLKIYPLEAGTEGRLC